MTAIELSKITFAEEMSMAQLREMNNYFRTDNDSEEEESFSDDEDPEFFDASMYDIRASSQNQNNHQKVVVSDSIETNQRAHQTVRPVSAWPSVAQAVNPAHSMHQHPHSKNRSNQPPRHQPAPIKSGPVGYSPSPSKQQQPPSSGSSSSVLCPVCNELVPSSSINTHLDLCEATSHENWSQCPCCDQRVLLTEMNSHLDRCMDGQLDDPSPPHQPTKQLQQPPAPTNTVKPKLDNLSSSTNHNKQKQPIDSPNTVLCPVGCGRLVPLDKINSHVDDCLTAAIL